MSSTHATLLRRPLPASLLVAWSILCSGCFLWTTRSEGDNLKRKTAAQEKRIAQLEQGLRRERQRLQSEVERAESKVQELEKVLEKATRVVKRNSADLGVEVDRLRQKLSGLKGELAELRHAMRQLRKDLEGQRADIEDRIDKVARRAGLDVSLDEEQIPKGRRDHYRAGKKAFEEGKHSRARALFRAYIDRYAESEGEHLDEAQYYIGASYLRQDKPATALGELRKVLADHGGGDAVDDALLNMANAFFRLGSCSDARAALTSLAKEHPRSPLLDEARRKLREIRRAPASKCTR